MGKPIITVKSTPTAKVSVAQKHTVIPNDYTNLKNLPTINGVEIIGNLTSDDIKVLSGLAENYNVNALQTADGKIVIFLGDGTPAAISVEELLSYIKSFECGLTEIVDDSGDVSKELKPNTFYIFTGELTSLVITFGATADGKQNEYMGQFSVSDTVPTLTFPNSVKWFGESPDIETGKTYQFSVLNDIGVIVGV